MALATVKDEVPSSSAPAPAVTGRHVVAATLGNALEFYDFTTYAFFAIQIGHAFFPAKGAFVSLMLSLATFGAGFITRPIGGIVIGAYADRVGRRAAMMLSFSLMGASILALAVIPPYAQIGLAAPTLAVIARLVQGLSLGGEVGSNTAYLLEAAKPRGRGLMVSLQGASQLISSMFGGLVGLGLTALLPHSALETYGWRIAFLLGAVTLPFGLLLRRTMPETLHQPEPAVARANSGAELGVLRANARVITLGLMIIGGGTITTYVTNYMTTFAQSSLHMAPAVAFAATWVPNGTGLAAILFGGWLSDRIGRRPVMIWPKLAHLVLVYPVFAWIVASRAPAVLLGGMAVLGAASAMGGGAIYAALIESLPKAVRGRAFATIYATAVAVFGGTTQPMVTWLIHVTRNPMAPAWYMLGSGAIALIAMTLMAESAPVRQKPILAAQTG